MLLTIMTTTILGIVLINSYYLIRVQRYIHEQTMLEDVKIGVHKIQSLVNEFKSEKGVNNHYETDVITNKVLSALRYARGIDYLPLFGNDYANRKLTLESKEVFSELLSKYKNEPRLIDILVQQIRVIG